jgi:hypothetical protein
MQDQLQQLLEKDRIIDTVTQLFIGTDTRDWPTVRACFADTVHFDMTSLAGGKCEPVDAGADRLRMGEGLRPLQAIHHQVGNYRVKLEGSRRRPSAMAPPPTTGRRGPGGTLACSWAATISILRRVEGGWHAGRPSA